MTGATHHRRPNDSGYVRATTLVTGERRYQARWRGQYLGSFETRTAAMNVIAVAKTGDFADYLEARAPTDHKSPGEYRVHLVQLRLCEGCLAGLGRECHTGGCAMCWHDSPGFRLIPELYEVIQEDA